MMEVRRKQLWVVETLTVKVGFSTCDVVEDSTTEVEEVSSGSSSARIWPTRAADE